MFCKPILFKALSCHAISNKAVVNVAVADQRTGQTLQALNFGEDKSENTQLLYLEPVTILNQDGDWAYTEANIQWIMVNDTWQPYAPVLSHNILFICYLLIQ
jgi:hypothetical protein